MKIKSTLFKTILVLISYFSIPNTSLAQDGSLDLSFDTDGIITTPIGTINDYGKSAAIQSDGKIIVVGYSDNGTNNDFAIARYNTNGSLDNTFGSTGKVTTPIGTNDDNATAVAIQADGKILVAGYGNGSSNYDIFIVRYNSDGSLDITFDTDGIVITSISGNDYADAIAIQSDGKIVVAGGSFTGSTTDFAVVRYNTDGSLDNTFDSDGKVVTPVGTANDHGYGLAIQSDGKIVVTGVRFYVGASADVALIRYNTNGSLDTTFDLDGKVTTSFGTGDDHAYSVVIQSDGKIVVGGDSNGIFTLARYNANGSLDNTYDSDGIVSTVVGASNDLINSIALQTDGKIVAAGYAYVSNQYAFALVRYNTNGSLDNTFDSDGIATTHIGTGSSFANNISIQSDGKIILAGKATDGGQPVFAVARYNNTITSGINSNTNQRGMLNIFPNPFSNEAIIRTDMNLNNAALKVYNVQGELVSQIDNISGNNVPFRRDNLVSGTYFIKLTQENKTIATEKITIVD